jgi:mannose-6-phosphate isomerase
VKIPAEPLFFKPIYKETIWGGSALRTRFNRPLAPDQLVGESWEVVNLETDQSMVEGGPLSGTALGRLAAESADELLGKIDFFGKFPLLYKFIDARDRLSVQVHPDDAQARENGWGEFGKTECWYVVDAKKDARIVVGFREDVTHKVISRAIENGSLHELLNIMPVKSGDVLFIPAGTVHAIMEGTVLYEIQETSDTTLRLYDWGRVDGSGKPRSLHVRDALKVIDTIAHERYRISPITLEECGCLHSYWAACRYFALEQYRLVRAEEFLLPAKQSFSVLTVINGAIRLHYPAGNTDVQSGTTVVLPAVLRDVRVAGIAGADLLLSSVPDLQREIISPLRLYNIPDRTIMQLGGFPEHNDLIRFL